MADEGLLIPIQFSLEEARSALAQLESQARAAGQRTGEGVSAGVGKGLSGLKAQLGPARESMMFFTSALGEFGPAGRTAQTAITGLVGAIAGGGGLLLVLEGARLAASLVSDAMGDSAKEAEKFGQDMKRAAEESTRRLAELAQQIEHTRLVSAGLSADQATAAMTQRTAAEEYRRAAGTVASLREEIAELRANPYIGSDNRIASLKLELAKWEAASAAATAYRNQLEVLKATQAEVGRAAQGGVADRNMGAVAEAAKAAAALAATEARAGDAAAVARVNAELAEEVRAANERAAMRQVEEDAKERARQKEIDHESFLMKWMEDRHLATLAAYEAQRQALENSLQMGAVRQFTQSVANAFTPVLTRSAAYNRAMKAAGVATQDMADFSAAAFAAMAQNALASMATEAAGRALFNLGLGLSMSAMGNPKAAEAYAAAAEFAIVAGMGGAGALAIGATRGTTKAERASVEAAAAGQDGAVGTTGGAREFGGGSTSSTGGTVTIRETVFIVAGSEFESPAETARRAARTLELVKRLDLERRAEG
jgi:hypothetical protein